MLSLGSSELTHLQLPQRHLPAALRRRAALRQPRPPPRHPCQQGALRPGSDQGRRRRAAERVLSRPEDLGRRVRAQGRLRLPRAPQCGVHQLEGFLRRQCVLGGEGVCRCVRKGSVPTLRMRGEVGGRGSSSRVLRAESKSKKSFAGEGSCQSAGDTKVPALAVNDMRSALSVQTSSLSRPTSNEQVKDARALNRRTAKAPDVRARSPTDLRPTLVFLLGVKECLAVSAVWMRLRQVTGREVPVAPRTLMPCARLWCSRARVSCIASVVQLAASGLVL